MLPGLPTALRFLAGQGVVSRMAVAQSLKKLKKGKKGARRIYSNKRTANREVLAGLRH